MFIVYCRDAENREDLRKETRPQHIEYLKQSLDVVRCAGPLLDSSGHPTGGLFVLDVDTREAANAWARADPLAGRGVYGCVEVVEWKYMLGDGVRLDRVD